MARRGFGGMNALRAALGAATGVAEGLQQRDLLAEEKRKQTLLEERQKAQDAAALRREMREALNTPGMVTADQFNQFAAADMPGATPRMALRQKVGDQEFVYAPSVAQSQKHRMDILAEQRKRAGEAEKQSDVVEALRQVESGKKKLTEAQVTAWSKLDRQERSSLVNKWIEANAPKEPRGGGGDQLDEYEREMMGLQFISAQARNPALTAALRTAFAQNPELAKRPGLVAYQVMKRRTVPILGAGQGYEPPKPEKPKAETADDIIAIAKQKEAAKKGGAAGAAAPAAAPAPSKPAPSATNSALEENRRLWDAAVAQYGRDRVLAEYGPRP